MIRSALVFGFAVVMAVPAVGQAPKEKASIFFETGGHTGHINAALFTKDSKQLITVADDKTIRFWDVERGEQVKVLYPPIGPGAEGSLLAAALSSDGKTLAVGATGTATKATGNRPSSLSICKPIASVES